MGLVHKMYHVVEIIAFSSSTIFCIPISFAVSNNGFLRPSPKLAAFSISLTSLAPFVTSQAALFSTLATICV